MPARTENIETGYTHAIPIGNLQPLCNVVQTVHGEGLTSKLITKLPLKAGQILYPIVNAATNAAKKYTSIQLAENLHCEFNSDLVYMNHSCDPSVIVDTQYRLIIAIKDLNVGDEITFFYPSTEWDMEQPFECWCGASKCVKLVKGAKHLSKDQLSDYFINSHIFRMKQKQS